MALVIEIDITNAGGTFTIPTSPFVPDIVRLTTQSLVTLTNDVAISFDVFPTSSVSYICWGWSGGVDMNLNGRNFTINGATFDQQYFNNTGVVTCIGSDAGFVQYYSPSINSFESILGQSIVDGSLALTKLEALTSGRIIVGSGANVPTAVAVTGDVTISNTGVTAIGSGVIVNADINASAAIARTKIADGTADHVVINNGSGTLTSEAQLDPERGGTGADNSSATGFQLWNAGTSSVGAITETMTIPVSFETGEVGTIFVDIPYACTILSYQFVCTKALAGTDAGTIQFADNAGTNMTGGLATIPASTAFGTKVGATITANNTVAINDDIRITTAKTTAGGRGFVSITLTRLA